MTEESYDKWRELYKEVAPRVEEYQELIDKTKEAAGIRDGQRILDIGVGVGGLTYKIASELKCEITAIDIEENAVHEFANDLTKRKSRSVVKLKVADAMKLPFKRDCFDAVVSTLTLHHLGENQKLIALRQVYRVLKPGGKLAIGEIVLPYKGRIDEEWRAEVAKVWANIIRVVGKYNKDLIEYERDIMQKKVQERNDEYMISGDYWQRLFVKASFRDAKFEWVNKNLGYGVIVGTK